MAAIKKENPGQCCARNKPGKEKTEVEAVQFILKEKPVLRHFPRKYSNDAQKDPKYKDSVFVPPLMLMFFAQTSAAGGILASPVSSVGPSLGSSGPAVYISHI